MLRSAATGNTTASRAKSLLLHIEQTRGASEADAFLHDAKLDREYLEDETRPLAVDRWHAALQVFAGRYGPLEFRRMHAAVIHPENLGVWARVLRGAADPATAYEQLPQYGGEPVATDVWETVSSEPTRWCGRVTLVGDDPDELVALTRTAELACVPLLFGLRPAHVTCSAPEADASGALIQEFRADWAPPSLGPMLLAWWGGALVLLVLIISSLGTLLATASVFSVVVLAVWGGAPVLRRRRAAARAQLFRLLALERSASLREKRDRAAQGFVEGSVVADQYRLTERIGSGANGAVWEALRLSDGAKVAVKVLRAGMAQDTLAADRLRREAAALGLAWHPNVVEVIEDGSLPDGTIYVVMERLRGESLAKRLSRQRHLSSAELLPIAFEVCDALGAVHAAGVVHRDLKPSNVFLHAPEPEAPLTVKLLDFGIARVEWAETRITNVGAPLGTPGYMSPEQQEGLEVDPRSDLFAFGHLLYECLTGEAPPVQGGGLWRAPDGGPRSGVQRALLEVPEGWREVIERATEPAADDRYPDARAMRNALAALAAPRATPLPRSGRA